MKRIRPNVVNTAKQISIEHGETIELGNISYRGRTPGYSLIKNELIKTSPGIPFVRLSMKPHEVKISNKLQAA